MITITKEKTPFSLLRSSPKLSVIV